MLKVGFINYKNTIPFNVENIEHIDIVRDYPSNLNRLLFQNQIDVGIISSGEYIEHYFKYFILPDLSISSKKDVRSVVILSNKPIENIDRIYLTRESKTSIFLTKIVFEKFLNKKPEYEYLNSIKNKEAVMLIGDKALELQGKFRYCYDLSNLWYSFTSLPFTFALWCVNKESFLTKKDEIINLWHKLKENRENFFKKIDLSDIDSVTKEYLKNIDYSLTDIHIESLNLFSKYLQELGLIKSIPDYRFIDGIVVTRDRTKTFFNFEYMEAYHSTKAGAYTESLEKFIKPSNLEKFLNSKKNVDILDVGFGLGYNVATAINFAKRLNKKPNLNIVSIEKDPKFLERIKDLEYPDILREEKKFICNLKQRSLRIGNGILRCFSNQDNGITLTVLVEDGRKALDTLNKMGKRFDIVFYDPFSPKVNTEMWTIDIFRILYDLLTEEGIFTTYSNAIPVKIGLLETGFKIGYIDPVGRKSPSLIATKNGDIKPLDKMEIEKIRNSKFAVPYRDKDFSLTGKQIWENWEKEVEKNSTSLV